MLPRASIILSDRKARQIHGRRSKAEQRTSHWYRNGSMKWRWVKRTVGAVPPRAPPSHVPPRNSNASHARQHSRRAHAMFAVQHMPHGRYSSWLTFFKASIFISLLRFCSSTLFLHCTGSASARRHCNIALWERANHRCFSSSFRSRADSHRERMVSCLRTIIAVCPRHVSAHSWPAWNPSHHLHCTEAAQRQSKDGTATHLFSILWGAGKWRPQTRKSFAVLGIRRSGRAWAWAKLAVVQERKRRGFRTRFDRRCTQDGLYLMFKGASLGFPGAVDW